MQTKLYIQSTIITLKKELLKTAVWADKNKLVSGRQAIVH